MQNVTWVIDFRRRAPAAVELGNPIQALEVVRRQRRCSRLMFAATRALLAEARAVLDARTRGASPGRRGRTPSTRSRGRVPNLR
jgi:hypothetical protein